MPRDYLFTKEEILSQAIELTREKGFDCVSARTLALKLGTSPRPIFSLFQNMKELQDAIILKAYDIYNEYIKKSLESKELPYKASGKAYILFSRNEKELFKLLFMNERSRLLIPENDEQMNIIYDIISRQLNITKEEAYSFHLEMWIYVHGLASMICTGYINWDDEFIDKTLEDVYSGLKSRYQNNI